MTSVQCSNTPGKANPPVGPRGLAALPSCPYSTIKEKGLNHVLRELTMSIDKSLRRKNQLERSRNVLTRTERIKVLQGDDRWTEGRSPFGLPKVRVMKVGKKGKGKAKEEAA